MALTYGFYNAVNDDRKYSAEQLSKLFDGLITDGVFHTVGDALIVKHANGNSVTVGTGRAWFNGTWTLNDTLLPVTLQASDVVLDRIDAIVLEVDKNIASRKNSIIVVKGTPSSQPVRPKMKKTLDVFQYPLAYIYRSARSTSIKKSDITSAVGTSETPFVIGVVKSMTIDYIVSRWEDEWSTWISSKKKESDKDMDEWRLKAQGEFEDWFDDIQDLLATNDKGALAGKLKALQDRWDLLEKDMVIQHYLIDRGGADNVLDSVGRPILGVTKYVQL